MVPHDHWHHGTRIQRDVSYKFHGTKSIDMPVVSQQRDLQVNPKESTLMIQIISCP